MQSQRGGLSVHRRHEALGAHRVDRQRVRGVVGADRQQSGEELRNGHPVPRLQIHLGLVAGLTQRILGDRDQSVWSVVLQHDHRREQLDRARGGQLFVRVVLPEHRAGVEVDQDARLRVDARLAARRLGGLAEAERIDEQPEAVPRRTGEIGHRAAGREGGAGSRHRGRGAAPQGEERRQGQDDHGGSDPGEPPPGKADVHRP